MKNPRGALDLLASIDDSSFTAQISEAYGDALMTVGKVTEAEAAYRKAQNLSKDKIQSPLLKIKMRQF
jgi:predicted negative regulator of RcsB-dependent stress response